MDSQTQRHRDLQNAVSKEESILASKEKPPQNQQGGIVKKIILHSPSMFKYSACIKTMEQRNRGMKKKTQLTPTGKISYQII